MMTMKEACEYQVNTRKERAQLHRAKVIEELGDDGIITGFTLAEKRRVKIIGKTSYSKGKKAAYNSIWRHNDLPRITKHT